MQQSRRSRTRASCGPPRSVPAIPQPIPRCKRCWPRKDSASALPHSRSRAQSRHRSTIPDAGTSCWTGPAISPRGRSPIDSIAIPYCRRPHDKSEFLDLVEVPLNMWVDAFDLFDGNQSVSREDMSDCHYDWARDNDGATAVAIGVHADVVAGEKWGSGPISKVIDEFLVTSANAAPKETRRWCLRRQQR